MNTENQILYTLGEYPYNSGTNIVQQSSYLGEGRFIKFIAQHNPEFLICAIYEASSSDMYSGNDNTTTITHHETLFTNLTANNMRIIPISTNKVLLAFTMRSSYYQTGRLYYTFVNYNPNTGRITANPVQPLDSNAIVSRGDDYSIAYKIIEEDLYLFYSTNNFSTTNRLYRFNLEDENYENLITLATNGSNTTSNPPASYYHDANNNKLLFFKRNTSPTSGVFTIEVDLIEKTARSIGHDSRFQGIVQLSDNRFINIYSSNTEHNTTSIIRNLEFSVHERLSPTNYPAFKSNVSPICRTNSTFSTHIYRLDEFHFILFTTRRDINRMECRVMRYVNDDIVQVANNSNSRDSGFNIGFYRANIVQVIDNGQNVIREGENKFYFQNDYNSFIFFKFDI